MSEASKAGMDALHSLKSAEPPLWLTPSATLSQTSRAASQHLFSCLKPHAPKSPFDKLLVEGFDAEQIWQQIDLLTQPLLSSIRHQVRNLEKNPEEIKLVIEKKESEVGEEGENKESKELHEFEEDDDEDADMEDFEDDEDGDDNDDDEEEENVEREGGIEDKFLKIKELEEYLEEDEAREYGLDSMNIKKKKQKIFNDSDKEEDDEDEEEDESDDEDDKLDDEDEDAEELGNARYEDFFGAKKKTDSKRKSNLDDGSDEDSGSEVEKEGDLSTHQKQREKLKSEIEQMEKANLEPKTWTMRGEVTAADRPKNSALEVDLDFEHNVRPAPVITEEVTASLEDMIKSRIAEGRFDDIQKLPSLPSTAPREVKEMDENKSKKGLAEVYEEEYVQKTNPAAAPISFSDEQKKEASILFKKLCLKLDALSHFHFAPKPVIEDMSIQVNVPALAMEEIAPMAVSDAAMLAPEEVFSGKGDIKEEAELTQAERKRRRAKKKRKFKAEGVKRMAKRARDNTTLPDHNDGKE
ncbi:U3 small nucleolar ribonucleoprotein protein MPP10 [Ricinus communis]|uniref:U3 small nucleolar ribonucleoprotein protein MPP10 n=1 Tax=Ricinus communis TaxID=3988 RepID=UPI0007727D9C|nr:U3 small nucleolar ribonucleoprotein protein MPP10 [Ricinus communis]|eukprot:XP_002511381.2 U3 small nucleolar ribonucleoprotein protein MPP10 [Ricinus communis]